MKRLRESMMRIGGLFNKQRKDRELNEEIESHLQFHIEDNLRVGMTPEEARQQAMIKLGGIESTKEAYRDQRGLPVLETLWQDIRYGAQCCARIPALRSWPCSRSRSASERTPRSSASSTAFCCTRCLIATQVVSESSR